MFKKILTIILYFFGLLTALSFIMLLLQKDLSRQTFKSLDLVPLFDKYPILDFIFDIPLMIIVAIAFLALTVAQFRTQTLSEKLRMNGISLMSIWVILLIWLAIIYAPFY